MPIVFPFPKFSGDIIRLLSGSKGLVQPWGSHTILYYLPRCALSLPSVSPSLKCAPVDGHQYRIASCTFSMRLFCSTQKHFVPPKVDFPFTFTRRKFHGSWYFPSASILRIIFNPRNTYTYTLSSPTIHRKWCMASTCMLHFASFSLDGSASCHRGLALQMRVSDEYAFPSKGMAGRVSLSGSSFHQSL